MAVTPDDNNAMNEVMFSYHIEFLLFFESRNFLKCQLNEHLRKSYNERVTL